MPDETTADATALSPTASVEPSNTAEIVQTSPETAISAQNPEMTQTEPSSDVTPLPTEPITETGTAQTVGSEPLPISTPEGLQSAGVTEEAPRVEAPMPAQGSTSQSEPTQTPVQPLPASVPAQAQGSITPNRNIVHALLEKARAAIQLRKQKKLLKIMTLFEKRTHITNDEVEKLLHVSDATATRYLSHLEQQGKIKQSGKTGKAVRYVKV